VLVGRALRLLQVQRHERVIDWFCGLGNFTLPLATMAAQVLGVEGSEALVERALDNARSNAVARPQGQALAPVRFVTRNLFEMTAQMLMADGVAQKWLMDPPREGAFALVQALAITHNALRHCAGGELAPEIDASTLPAPGDWTMPQRIVYVSCNPATLARDAAVLVHQAGYRCVGAGVVNMFAHTAHVESIAVFERLAH
jgi:23S rRNA (uracil1939-C5)-methyltransferase